MTLFGDCYRILHRGFSRKPSKFGWVIEGKLAASGRIMSRSQLAWAQKHGIKSVLTIRERPLREKWFPEGCGIHYRHLKVEDYGAPPLKELDEIIDYVKKEIANDNPIVIHCNGGTGRTGTVLAAYLMKKEGLTAKQAIERVREIRGRAPRRKKQLDTLSQYENYLKHQNDKR